jgi:exodeoxyribonuclease VII large subunit
MEISVRQPPAAASLSVGQVLALAKSLLEESFLGLWIEGEVANFRPAPSGHWYFSLKDARGGDAAEMKVAMFRGRNLYAPLAPRNGMLLRVRGRLTVYEARGELQMVAEQLEDAGAGAAARAFDALKALLAAQGLFDAQFKKSLPRFPRRIALVSSPTGAAVHDFLTVLARRFPLTQVEIWPSLVQGELAPAQLLAALVGIHRHVQRYDVIVLTRGGGAAQDLAAFNDEALVRAVAASVIPVVSAIGHEIDVTLCDLAADLRAATPTAAAELITPDQFVLAQHLRTQRLMLRRYVRASLEPRQQRLDYARRLLDAHAPAARLRALYERLFRANRHLVLALENATHTARATLDARMAQLMARAPVHQAQALNRVLTRAHERLTHSMQHQLATRAHRMALLSAQLGSLNPRRTLERGYVLVRDSNGKVLSAAHDVACPSELALSFHDGVVLVTARAQLPTRLDASV